MKYKMRWAPDVCIGDRFVRKNPMHTVCKACGAIVQAFCSPYLQWHHLYIAHRETYNELMEGATRVLE
jgi:hypothetical protein